jgi:phosphoribosylpyrophosphate synthetase
MTTGATLSEAARVLRENGATAVFAAVVARTQAELSNGEIGRTSAKVSIEKHRDFDS